MAKYLFVGTPVAEGRQVHGDLVQLHDGRRFIVNNAFGACIDDEGRFINTGFPYVVEVKPESIELYARVDATA